ncbi:MAG: hypothetical protein GKR94_11085 [Gammaproteobacteria bacterium]|nr:hypothetical protein [Gammaproteobacteria bacterium]
MGESQRVFALEVTRKTPIKPAFEQFYEYLHGLSAIRARFECTAYTRTPFVLSVHHDSSTFRQFRQRVLASPAFEPALRGLLFTELEALKTGFASAWCMQMGRR